ncbi:MAG: LacI family transcriptional regulator [Hyphomicrobiales bacterium]|nr:MAG: LacI family transcriptional regulator [Hyphomicrobiales bacterium]
MPTPARLTINDVARAAGVSRGTVSNVFSHPERVRPELRERVETVARDIGYGGPDPRGRLLRRGKFGAVGYVVPGAYGFVNLIESPFGREMLLGVADACDAAGISLTLIDGRAAQIEAAVDNALVDGLIIGTAGSAPVIERAMRRGMRVAIVDVAADAAISSVSIDAVTGAKLAARHLLDLGHRRFAIVSVRRTQGEPIDHAPGRRTTTLRDGGPLDREKLRGYSEALTAAGLDINAMPVLETVPWQADIGPALFAAAPDATAILVMSDRQAMTILRDFARLGRRVPEQASIVGFDGVPDGAAALPPLTTIEQPTREKARRATELALSAGPAQHSMLSVKLLVRASSGPAPA